MRTALLAILVAASASAQSSIVYGNMGPNNEGVAPDPGEPLDPVLDENNTDITSSVRLGSAFNTADTTFIYLNALHLGFSALNSGNYTVSIVSGTNTVPHLSNVLASSTRSFTIQEEGLFRFAFANFVFAPNTTYWVIPDVGLSWYTAGSFDLADEYNSSSFAYVANRRSTNSGTTWSNFLVPFSIAVEASNVAPIPEPSTYGMILGGLALAGAALRRRQKAAK
jgi:hypothetical protein